MKNEETTENKRYLNFNDFCQVEVDIEDENNNNNNKENNKSNYTLKTKKQLQHKWPNKVFDYEKLNYYHSKVFETFTLLQEHLIFGRVDEINIFTCTIPLNKVFYKSNNNENVDYLLINRKKNLFVDNDIFNRLKNKQQLNWSSTLATLYPIKTIGDGNCLCHAVLSYLIGLQDTNLILRESLKNYINDDSVTNELKFRWLTSRKAEDKANSIETEDKIVDKVNKITTKFLNLNFI
jgi:hypothetical protein